MPPTTPPNSSRWRNARLTDSGDELKEFEGVEQRSASAGSQATTKEHAARHRAVATAATVTATANRLPDTPEVGGYVDGGHIPVTAPPPAPAESVPSTSAPPSPRQRQAAPLRPER